LWRVEIRSFSYESFWISDEIFKLFLSVKDVNFSVIKC
jgi:hypothetical protein